MNKKVLIFKNGIGNIKIKKLSYWVFLCIIVIFLKFVEIYLGLNKYLLFGILKIFLKRKDVVKFV